MKDNQNSLPHFDGEILDQIKLIVIAAVQEAMKTDAQEDSSAFDNFTPPSPHETKKHDKAEHLLTTEEAARFLSIKTQTLALWRTQGRGPVYFKLGSSVRYDLKELKSYIHSQRVGR